MTGKHVYQILLSLLCILLAVMDLTGFDRYTLSTRNNLDAIIARKLRGEHVTEDSCI